MESPGEDTYMEDAEAEAEEEGPNHVAELNRLEHRLRQEDAVMEPDTWDVVVRYLTAGGRPHSVVELFTDSYQGYAQMASLACRWLTMLGGAADLEPRTAAPTAADEFGFLQQLVEKEFDPAKFTDILAKGQGPPAWLDPLTSSHEGRQLIYSLARRHKDSLLLNYAIQKILLQGYVEEVAAVGDSVASFFGNFHRLLAARLQGAVAAEAPALRALSQELQGSCCASEHTYLHAQQLLATLGRLPGGAVLRRLSQDLEAHASAPDSQGRAPSKNHPEVFLMQHMFVPEGSPPEDVKAATLVGRMLHGGLPLAPPDVEELHFLFHRHSPPPHLTPLRQPKMLACLVSTAFTPQRGHAAVPDPDTVEKCIQLLGLGAAAREILSADGELEGIDEAEVAGVCSTLREALRLATAAGQPVPSRGLADPLVTAPQVLATPAAAMGVLHHITCLLRDPSFYTEPAAKAVVPTLLSLLAQTLAAHPGVAPLVLDAAWGAALQISNIEIAKQIMALLAHLVANSRLSLETLGRVKGAVEGKQLDPAFARYFISQVLALCMPPYSAPFATSVVQLLLAAGVRRSHGQRDPQMGQYLREFAVNCRQTPGVQLGSREAGLMDELRS